MTNQDKSHESDRSDRSDRSDNDPLGIASMDAEAAANYLICLINQASYLLGRQIYQLERNFLRNGGFTENLYKARRSGRTGKY